MSKRQRQTVFLFKEGTRLGPDAKKVLGGKGAGLAEMAALGLPIPPGFTVATTVARAFSEEGRLPNRMTWQLERGIAFLEKETGKGLGNPAEPLLVSVRSGAAVSMPGMMDTILNLGLTSATAEGLARAYGEEFARDCIRRFHEMFQKIVGEPAPDNAREQLEKSIIAVLYSWDSKRAVAYRNAHNIPHWWGTAVNVQQMVFGNMGEDSCTGVAFSRNTATGAPGLWGEFLINAQGEDVVSGTHTPLPIQEMKQWDHRVYEELAEYAVLLERHYNDVVDVEFTVERGKLYLLQCRVAQRSPEAAATIAVRKVWEKQWSREKALEQITNEQVKQLRRSEFDEQALARAKEERLITQGLPASPGAAVGYAVFSAERAEEMAASGKSPILIRPDTSPDDLAGMLASAAIVTAAGGATCHAAVVARGLGIPAVVGAELEFGFAYDAGFVWVAYAKAKNGYVIAQGELISVDGARGMVFHDELPLTTSLNKKEINIFLRWVERFVKIEPRVGFEWASRRVSVNEVISDFYISEAMAAAAAGALLEAEAIALRDKIHRETAEMLACYLLIAVAGELRDGAEASNCREKFPSKVERLRTHFHVQCERQDDNPCLDRNKAQTSAFKALQGMSKEEQAEFFRLASKLFHEGRWTRAYGGRAWGRISDATLNFLEGKLSHTAFADHVFDLRHNGGALFNKHRMVFEKTREGVIQRQLDVKKREKSLIQLYNIMTGYASLSPEVSELWEKGKRMNVWKE